MPLWHITIAFDLMNPICSKFFEDLFSVLVVAQYNSVVSINISSSILRSNFCHKFAASFCCCQFQLGYWYKFQRSYSWLWHHNFTKDFIIFTYSLKVFHLVINWLVKMVEAAMLDLLFSKRQSFLIWQLLDILFPFLPKHLNRLWSCFIQF